MGVQKKTRKFAAVKRTYDLVLHYIAIETESLQHWKATCGPQRKFAEAGCESSWYEDAFLLENTCADDGLENDNPNKDEITRVIPQVSSSLFFQYNTALKPPYSVLVDTNFLSHTVQNKLEMLDQMMTCLYAECRYGPPLGAKGQNLKTDFCFLQANNYLVRHGRIRKTWSKISNRIAHRKR